MTSNLSATKTRKSPGAAAHPLGDLGQKLRAEVLGDRRGQRAALLDLEPGQPLGAEVLHDERRELVDVFARIAAGRSLDVHAADPIAALGHLAEDAELGLAGQIGDVDQFQAETQVGGVVAKPLHRLVVGHPRQRQLELQAEDLLRQPGHQPVDHADDVLRGDERHFQVQLRELRLPVGPQVLVAEATGDLDIAVVAGDHEDLLVELRRLRQGIEMPLHDAAGHEVIAGPFRRASPQHGGLDLDEPLLVEVVAHRLDDAVPQQQRLLHLLPPQVDIAVLQPQVLAGQIGAAGLERRRGALVEDLQVADPKLDLAGLQLRIHRALGPPGDLAADQDHVLRPQGLGLLQGFVAAFRGENDLRLSVAIAKIGEQLPPMVPIGIDPAAEGDLLTDMIRAKFAASMSPQQSGNPFNR